MASALKLLELPRQIGTDPQTGNMISAGIGRFGPFLKTGDLYVQIPAGDDVLTIGLNRAVDLVVAKHESVAKRLIRDIGEHPKSKAVITAYKGRFGPYIKSGKLMANVPKTIDIETMSVEDAVALLEAKGKTPGKGKAKGKTAAKAEPKPKVKKPAAKAKTKKTA